MLVTRWQTMDSPSHHRPTTDGSTDTDVDYDYISNENENHSLKQPTQVVLPLSPITDSYYDSIDSTVDQDNVNHQNTSILENVIMNHDQTDANIDYFREQDAKNGTVDSNKNMDKNSEIHHMVNKTEEWNSDKSDSESDRKEINISQTETIDDKHVYVYENEELPTTVYSSDQQSEQTIIDTKLNETDIKIMTTTESNTYAAENATTLTYSTDSSEKSETDESISDIEIATTDQFLEYIDAIMLNDSLLFLDDNNSSDFNDKTDMNFYEFTTESNSESTVETTDPTVTETSSSPEESTYTVSLIEPSTNVNFSTEQIPVERLDSMESSMQNNMISDMSDEEPADGTENIAKVTSSLLLPPILKVVDPMRKISLSLSSLIRFPTDDGDDDERAETYRERQPIKSVFNFKKVRFPDQPLPNSQTTMISWPRDNGYFNFWRDQPLIISDSHAKAFSSNNNLFSRGLFSILQNNNKNTNSGA